MSFSEKVVQQLAHHWKKFLGFLGVSGLLEFLREWLRGKLMDAIYAKLGGFGQWLGAYPLALIAIAAVIIIAVIVGAVLLEYLRPHKQSAITDLSLTPFKLPKPAKSLVTISAIVGLLMVIVLVFGVRAYIRMKPTTMGIRAEATAIVGHPSAAVPIPEPKAATPKKNTSRKPPSGSHNINSEKPELTSAAGFNVAITGGAGGDAKGNGNGGNGGSVTIKGGDGGSSANCPNGICAGHDINGNPTVNNNVTYSVPDKTYNFYGTQKTVFSGGRLELELGDEDPRIRKILSEQGGGTVQSNEQCIADCREIMKTDPLWATPHILAAYCYSNLWKLESAKNEVKEARNLVPAGYKFEDDYVGHFDHIEAVIKRKELELPTQQSH